MRGFGFKLDNNAFENHSWYFRNALVKANYNDLQNGIHAKTEFLERFFSNLLLGTNYELKNRTMHVDFKDDLNSTVQSTLKVHERTLECTLNEQAVLNLIKEDPTLTQQEIHQKLGLSLGIVKRATLALQQKGYIERVGGKKHGRWELISHVGGAGK